ncbi:NADPH-cytochrome p450 reductase-like protein [Strigomonas culicis]|uniref:NADPH-cytochrome p450 reductase-like protein n=1 Tax=Strigomonas culicis TaxID=28005 RepID=S9V782_9TRYP|nr:NADPH-cytochrome p450 reductase-like protein [Strigomonas culicis]|eukprot:EPY18790.1 NADPH-cytochrome p450 reductase-like protein [Strigomonas culicis]
MTLYILYGTQAGNAERIAQRVARYAVKRGAAQVHCLPAEETSIQDWGTWGAPVLFISATANQGNAPITLQKTWNQLQKPSAPSLAGLRYAVYGIGDSIYGRFNFFGEMLHKRLQELGGAPLLPCILGDESDRFGLDETLMPWCWTVWVKLGYVPEEDPVAAGEAIRSPLKEGADDTPLFPLFDVRPAAQGAAPALGADAALAGTEGEAMAVPRMEPMYTLRVLRNALLTAAGHFQHVRHLELRPETLSCAAADGGAAAPVTAPIPYLAGDALSVYCANVPAQVEALLQRLGYAGDEVVTVTPDTTHGIVASRAEPFLHRAMTVRYLLTYYVDLNAVASQEFLWMLGLHVVGDDEGSVEVRERLLELSSARHIDEFLQYSHREKRNVIEVLHDFKMVTPSLAHFLTFACPMRPRYYDISSAPGLDGDVVHLTVAQLQLKTPLKREREGLCSSHLVRAAEQSRVQAGLWQGTLEMPEEPAPLLFMATSTGIAPVRSIIRTCAADPKWKEMPIYLFYGCRFSEKDYLYGEEWERLKEERMPNLQVVTAFSRDTDTKVYVQHRVAEHAKLVASLLLAGSPDAKLDDGNRSTFFFLCGNANEMPVAVQGVFQTIITEVVYPDQVEKILSLNKRMTGENRFQMDTWSS